MTQTHDTAALATATPQGPRAPGRMLERDPGDAPLFDALQAHRHERAHARVAVSKPFAWPMFISAVVRSGATTPSRTKRPTLSGKSSA